MGECYIKKSAKVKSEKAKVKSEKGIWNNGKREK